MPSATELTVVGIGASAGGLAALKTLLGHVPSDSGLAFVVVVHLAPDHESHLAELLQAKVKIPVTQVTETTPLEKNHVYVIPPNCNLSAIDTHLRLSPMEERRLERAPIDHFFRTLAATHDGHSIAVILTGTGSDGTLGVKDIKAHGGVVIIQDPKEAEFDGMPQSARATGLVDLILPVAEIPEKILRFDRTQPRIPQVDEKDQIPQSDQALVQQIFTELRTRTNRDFSRYKRSTVLRRIARRMQLNNQEDMNSYLDKLREHPKELRVLADDLLITVTDFFRDPEVFAKLQAEEIPRIFAEKRGQNPIRVWSVGCATGEEAYSLAILLKEEAEKHSPQPPIQIFASDLHMQSLEKAREGLYVGNIEADVGLARLQRFFNKESGGYRVRKEIRDLIVFAPHNLLSDPPFLRLDLISCRNLLIYLDREVQRDVIDLFSYALNPDGLLVLGSAETVEATDLFNVEDKKLCLFRKRKLPSRNPRIPVFPISRRPMGDSSASAETDSQPPAYGNLHQRMVEEYAPPSVLVGREDQVLHLSQHVGRYFIHPGGEPTDNVMKLVRPELRLELEASMRMARSRKTAFDSKPILVQFNGHPRPVVMHIRPALEKEREGCALIIFEEREPAQQSELPQNANEAEKLPYESMENELRLVRQRMQVIIEDYENNRQEMSASNEDMQSTNEELLATMEELETSKEELQSINEELQTVNQQNKHKVEELGQLSSDLQNLLSATDIATLFLDRELRILRFTPRLSQLFNARLTDRGRPISDLTHRLGYPELRQDAQTVLGNLIPVERAVQDEAGRWYLARVLPYRSSEDRIEGVVITFVDVDKLKRAEEALRQSEERLKRVNSDLTHFSYAVSHDMLEPLRMVTSYTQLLGRQYNGQLDATGKQYIDFAVEGAKRMELLLNGLREYWSVDSVQPEKFGPCDLSEILDRAVKFIQPVIEENQATITRDALPEVKGEEYSLQLMFQNLLANAIKYRRPGVAPQIRVTAERNGTMATFSIADNGIGIDPSEFETIFAPFKRLHGARYPGMGLGLAMCRRIAEQHLGRIWVTSVDGQGSTFHVQLPVGEGH